MIGDQPRPPRELKAVAARSEPWLSSPPVPSTCPKQQSAAVNSGQQRSFIEVPYLRHRRMASSQSFPSSR